jgi:ABC-2 type transport system permease protein
MVKLMKQVKKHYKRNNILQLVYGLIIIVTINVIGQYVYTRMDLTSEKRYSLSEPTKDLLKNLDEYIFFKVYLEGEFPAGFKRLRNETREMLNEFRAYSKYVEFEFVNPSESEDEKERNEVYQLLIEKGLQPTNVHFDDKSGSSEKLVFPGAIVNYLNKETSVELLKNQLGMPPEEVLNNSIENLEFTLASSIRQLTVSKRPNVAFIEGHGELSIKETADIGNELSEYYNVSRVKLNEQLNSLTDFQSYDSSGRIIIKNKFDALIIAKPDSAFSEKDKFIIDQFLMRGGKILWLIDPVYASMDSLQSSRTTLGFGLELNLTDMFFKYGVRMNQELLMDLNARPIPIVTGMVGNQPKQEYLPWYYFPVVSSIGKHPVVNNLNAVMTTFSGTLDTISSANVRKTPLLASSDYTRVSKAPALIDLQIMDSPPDQRMFSLPPKMVAVLVEGQFNSLFANRIPPQLANNDSIGFQKESKETAQIFVSDGDIIKNQLHYSKGYPLPLGFDQFTRQTFGNKDFILNALNYLIDENGLISIRSREIKIRLLDKNKMAQEMLLIKTLNVAIPVLMVLLLGLILQWRRKRKYTHKHN